MLFAMGLFRLGTLVRFIPVAVVIGFTNGIAVLQAALPSFNGKTTCPRPNWCSTSST
jgi:hypothetical protein